MGCDIRAFIERKKDNDEDTDPPVWEHVPGWVVEDWQRDERGRKRKPRGQQLWISRNYALFGLLAGIRADIKPIAKPRGLPADVSPEVAQSAKDWGRDGHTHSWLTLKEMQDYNPARHKAKYEGLVALNEYVRWKKSGDPFPKSWCGGAWGSKIIDEVAVPTWTDLQNNVLVRARWTASVRDAVSPSAWEMVKGLLTYVQRYGDPEDVRLVFWFDN